MKIFWRDFTRQYWKQATVIKNIFAHLITEREIFDALIHASENILQDESIRLRLYSGKIGKDAKEQFELLPTKNDDSFTDFLQRYLAVTEESEVCLILNHLQRHCAPEVWFRIRKFLEALYPFIGIPSSTADMVVFLGNYAATPFGVHYDYASVMSLVIAGCKRFLVWPAEFFKAENFEIDPINHSIQDLDISLYREYATEVVGYPGDIIFLPERAWHIAVSDPNFNLSVSIGLFNNEVPTHDSLDMLTRFSASGFKIIPALRNPIKIFSNNKFISSGFKIIWIKNNDVIYYAINGHLFKYFYSENIEKIAKLINQKNKFQVADILKFGDENLIKDFLQKIYQARGIEISS